MLNDKFLKPEDKCLIPDDKFLDLDETYTKPSQNNECCESTPLNRTFICGCCLVIIINAAIWTVLYYWQNGYKYF